MELSPAWLSAQLGWFPGNRLQKGKGRSMELAANGQTKMKQDWLKESTATFVIVEVDAKSKVSAGYEDEQGNWIANEDYEKQIIEAHGKRIFIGEITLNGKSLRARSGWHKPQNREKGLNELLGHLSRGLALELLSHGENRVV